jgi:Uma2 family endonuclease
MSPPITAEQLSSIDDDRHRFELVGGRLRVMEPGGTPHSVSTIEAGRLLANWIRDRRLGMSLAGGPAFITQSDPDTVRAPDFAFIRAERIPDPIPEGYPEMAPDFAVEIAGRDDRPEAVHEKAEWWLASGVGEVWVLEPRSRTATIHLPGREPRTLGASEAIEASGPLAGFACRVAELFGI